MALIAWAGNATAASRYLKAEKVIAITGATLNNWRQERYAAKYEEMREKYAAQLEKQIEGDLREMAALAMQAERLAIQKAKEQLEAGEEKDPARAAANLARVAQSSVDKLMTISGRPTVITEQRNVEEILRGLVARGVLKAPDPPQLEAA
jgi:hypothetical protein